MKKDIRRLGFDQFSPVQKMARTEILTNGSGKSWLWEHVNIADGLFMVGAWQGDDMILEVKSYPQNEFFVVVSGLIELTTDGKTESFESGQCAFVPQGWKGQWRNIDKPRKFYAILRAQAE